MAQVLIYGVISSFSLVIGAAIGIIFKLRQKAIAAFMAFGAGVLICALSFSLIEEAFGHGGYDAVIIGFILGGVVFIAGDYILHFAGGRKHKRKPLMSSEKEASGSLITLGAILDGIPESIALGISLFIGHGTGVLMLVAIFISNFPEGISSISGLIKQGYSRAKILGIWFLAACLLTAVVLFSYLFLHDISLNNIGMIEAFAAGAILAMLADSMMPEAYEEGGFLIGFLTLLGFLAAFIVSKL